MVVFGKLTTITMKIINIDISNKRRKHVFEYIKRWMSKVQVVEPNFGFIGRKNFR